MSNTTLTTNRSLRGRHHGLASEVYPTVNPPVYPFESYTLDSSHRVTAVATTAGLHDATLGDIPDTTKSTTVVSNIYDTGSTTNSGRVTSQTNLIGNTTTFTWTDSSASVVAGAAMPGNTAQTVTYTHDTYGHVTSIRDPNTNSASKIWSQGTQSQVPAATSTSETDRVGTASATFYDAYGRVSAVAKADPSSGFVPPLADHAGLETCKRASDGSFPDPTSSACNVSGKHFVTESYTYVSAGSSDTRVDTHTDAAGQKTKYTYSGTSILPSTVTTGCQTYSGGCSSGDANAPAVTTTYTYSGNLVTSVADGDGIKTCTHYNSYNEVDFTTPGVTAACPSTAANTSTQYTYSVLGKIATMTKPSPQGTWTYTYFGTGQPKRVTDPYQNHVDHSYSYLSSGYAETVTDETGQSTTTTTTVAVTDQATCNGGIAGSAGNDPDNNAVFAPCETETVAAPSPAAPVTQIYDANRQLRLTATPTGAGGARSWNEYGNLGRISKSFDPDSVETQYSYDNDGRVTGTQNGGESGAAGTDATASTKFDARGRATVKATAKMDAAKVTTKYAYDANDRVIQEVGAAPDGTFPTPNADGTYPAPASSGNNWTFKATTYAPTGAVEKTALYRNDVSAGAGTQATVQHTFDAAGKETCPDTRVVAGSFYDTETHTYTATDYDTAGRIGATRVPIGSVTGCTNHVTGGVPDTTYWAVTATAYNNDWSKHWQENPVQYAAVNAAGFAGNATNYRTTFGYDSVGRQISVQSPDPSNPTNATATARTCYTARGETAMQIDAAGDVTATTYLLEKGVVNTVTDPTGMLLNAGTPCSSTAKTGADLHRGVTTFGYDGRGNRTSRATYNDAPSSQVTEGWNYDLANRPTGYTSNAAPAVNTTSVAYGITAGRLISKTVSTGTTSDASFRQHVETYAPAGVPTQVEDDICGTGSTFPATCANIVSDAGHKTTVNTTYDPLGRRHTVTDTLRGSRP